MYVFIYAAVFSYVCLDIRHPLRRCPTATATNLNQTEPKPDQRLIDPPPSPMTIITGPMVSSIPPPPSPMTIITKPMVSLIPPPNHPWQSSNHPRACGTTRASGRTRPRSWRRGYTSSRASPGAGTAWGSTSRTSRTGGWVCHQGEGVHAYVYHLNRDTQHPKTPMTQDGDVGRGQPAHGLEHLRRGDFGC